MTDCSNGERKAKAFIEQGNIDQAIEIYEDLQPTSPRILTIIGGLYADKKGDYNLAEFYFQNALRLQEEVNITRGYKVQLNFVIFIEW